MGQRDAYDGGGGPGQAGRPGGGHRVKSPVRGGPEPGVVDACWQALRPGGVLVANGVTLEAEAALAGLAAWRGGTLTRIDIARTVPLGSFTGWRPLMPVAQWSARKPA